MQIIFEVSASLIFISFTFVFSFINLNQYIKQEKELIWVYFSTLKSLFTWVVMNYKKDTIYSQVRLWDSQL